MRARFLSLLIGSMFAVASASGYEHAMSPNRRFEAYTTANNSDGTGMRLYLRAAGSSDVGVLLRENERWINTVWSPDSRFLALIDGSDGHVTDVFVYRVSPTPTTVTEVSNTSFPTLGEIATSARAPRVTADLRYHTPNPGTYDVQWDVSGWGKSLDIIVLIKRSRAPRPATIRVDLSSTTTRR